MIAKIDDNSKINANISNIFSFKLKQIINIIVFCLNQYFTSKNGATIALSRYRLHIIINHSKHSKQWRILKQFSPNTDETKHVCSYPIKQATHRYVISSASLFVKHMGYENHSFAIHIVMIANIRSIIDLTSNLGQISSKNGFKQVMQM